MYPTHFNEFIDDYIDESYSEHRRASNFYTRRIFEINEEYFPTFPELWGFWESNTFIFDSEYGFDKDEIDELTRVRKKIVIVETEEWVAE